MSHDDSGGNFCELLTQPCLTRPLSEAAFIGALATRSRDQPLFQPTYDARGGLGHLYAPSR